MSENTVHVHELVIGQEYQIGETATYIGATDYGKHVFVYPTNGAVRSSVEVPESRVSRQVQHCRRRKK